MPEIYLPGENEPRLCELEDYRRWDEVVLAGKARSREEAAGTDKDFNARSAPKPRREPKTAAKSATERPARPGKE